MTTALHPSPSTKLSERFYRRFSKRLRRETVKLIPNLATALIDDDLRKKTGRQLLQQLFQDLSNNFEAFATEVIGINIPQSCKSLCGCLSNKSYKKICIALQQEDRLEDIFIAYMLWEIAKNHNSTILIVSNKERTANSLMPQIVAHIERNKRYEIWARAIDPSGKGVVPKIRKIIKRKEKWGKNAITIDRSSLKLKDPTIAATGYRGSVLGRRTDTVIAYKLVDQKNAAIRKRRRKIRDWTYTTLLPVLVPGGRFIYWGRGFYKNDLVRELLSSKFFDYREEI